MLGNSCNEWPHQSNRIDDHKGVESRFIPNNMATSLASTLPPRLIMDHKITPFSKEEQQKQQQNNNNREPLRCPRCDSRNTKFCYYNNYSLSQPRHFCKACKRYWTRGGTLRNVPLGGGFRKNKKVKKRPTTNTNTNTSSSTTSNNNNNNTKLYDGSINSLPSNPLLYESGSPILFRDYNFTNFPLLRYDLQNPPQISGLGLGFSSGLALAHNNNINNNGDFRNGLISTNALLSNSTTPTTMSSLFASSFQSKSGANNYFETMLPSYEDGLQMKSGMSTNEVKMELEGQNREMSNQWSGPSQNEMGQNMGSSSTSDPAVIWGSGPNLGAWIDTPSNNNLSSSQYVI